MSWDLIRDNIVKNQSSFGGASAANNLVSLLVYNNYMGAFKIKLINTSIAFIILVTIQSESKAFCYHCLNV